jgi:prephenate dehydrogenase
MDKSGFFNSQTVAIVGLGLMGGSLALGLRGQCHEVLAVDPDPDTQELALRQGIIAQISADPAEIIPQADIIFLAAPVNVILDFIPRLPVLHPGNPVIIDLGSTKNQICEAFNKLPARFEPLGGHPMCGKAVGGLEHAEAELFQDTPFAFTPLARTTERALEIADHLATILRAQALWVGPKTHDQWVAATSHFPYLLATALTLSTPGEASHLVGPGFKSTSRLAGSPSSVMVPILETNRELVLEMITHFRQQLDDLEKLLTEQDYTTLRITLDHGSEHRSILTGL